MKYEITEDRNIIIDVKKQVQVLIPISELSASTDLYGFEKGVKLMLDTLLTVIGDETIKARDIKKLKKILKEILDTKISDLEKQYFIQKYKDLFTDDKNCDIT